MIDSAARSSRSRWLAAVLCVVVLLTLAVLPVLVLYALFSRQLIRGITAGAVK